MTRLQGVVLGWCGVALLSACGNSGPLSQAASPTLIMVLVPTEAPLPATLATEQYATAVPIAVFISPTRVPTMSNVEFAATATPSPAAPPTSQALEVKSVATSAPSQAPTNTAYPARTATAAITRPTATLVPGASEPALPGTIRIDGAFARSAPMLTAPRRFPVFIDNKVSAVARSQDGAWLAVLGPDGQMGWLLREYVAVQGESTSLSVSPAPPGAGLSAAALPAYLSVPATARSRYQAAISAGRDGRVFTVAGACNSEAYAFVRRVATGLYDTSGLPGLYGAIQRFGPSFARVSMAARGGYTAASLFEPDWVEPGLCPLGEGPLACELRRTRASVIFIEIGTGDQFVWSEFEARFRAAVDYALGVGALPVLVTKADDLDHQQGGSPPGYINDAIRRVARERDLPLIDFHAATRTLPNFGLLDEGNFDFHLNPPGSDLHLLATLQMLNAILQ